MLPAAAVRRRPSFSRQSDTFLDQAGGEHDGGKLGRYLRTAGIERLSAPASFDRSLGAPAQKLRHHEGGVRPCREGGHRDRLVSEAERPIRIRWIEGELRPCERRQHFCTRSIPVDGAPQAALRGTDARLALGDRGDAGLQDADVACGSARRSFDLELPDPTELSGKLQ
ncbi:hypothetical protein [Rhizobium sp. K102]|uniref:hypothetical protein n=1 Tax=Rhizobium sp. K102 TaxID=2918527 RepID=UPI001EFB8098|nr:hypothetical protein [Rhizobium sp. K102]ULR42519.1 hypothetical protein MHI61_03440 [Rhizobium sp. K102]